jgi:hypothetical protein
VQRDNGGAQARWRADGKELYFIRIDKKFKQSPSMPRMANWKSGFPTRFSRPESLLRVSSFSSTESRRMANVSYQFAAGHRSRAIIVMMN